MSRPARFTHLGVFSNLIDHSRVKDGRLRMPWRQKVLLC
jgi:hypothetical protein